MLTQTTALAPDGQPWQQVTLRNKSGMTVTVADWGATLPQAPRCRWPMQPAPTAAGLRKAGRLCSPGRISWRLGRPLRQPYRPQPLPA
ncbi:aldose 1-epimerase [Klebsiella pneumoniae subsp. ozaenae]|uniref:Aldose 1-epimerase n=1 Tax=Klebsiella pneumoniae subsp. ozaenae TaxID=574 RepID=A0A378BTE8_KLEPO|nr:aldose 1-epimerase [Klebsiella pneumoniae subsp. ozaenae]